MTLPLWVAGIGLGALVLYAVRAYRQARVREALDRDLDAQIAEKLAHIEHSDRLIRARFEAMDRAMSDSCACETCGAVTGRRELVSLFDDATLACDACAAILRGAA